MLETNRIVTVTLHPAVDHVIEVKQFAAGETCTGRSLAHYPAGKGVNVSRVAAQLGVDTIATGFVGEKQIGEFEQHLAGFGCTRAQFLAVQGDTRDNITVIDPEAQAHTHIRTRGFAVREEDVARLRRKLTLLARAGATFAFAGSLPPGLEPDSFARMLDAVARRGAAVVADTSGEALRVLRERRVDVLKVNQAELATLTERACGDIATTAAAARSLLEQDRAEVAIVTLGAAGALLLTSEIAWRGWVDLKDDEPVANTVGCGDALLAGVLADLQLRSQGSPADRWREALRLGLAAATANVVTSRAALIARADVRDFAERVHFEAL